MTPESLSIQFAAPVKVTDPADCDFYHRMDVPGLGQVGGAWDLRDCIKAYLGNYDFNGKRVLAHAPRRRGEAKQTAKNRPGADEKAPR